MTKLLGDQLRGRGENVKHEEGGRGQNIGWRSQVDKKRGSEHSFPLYLRSFTNLYGCLKSQREVLQSLFCKALRGSSSSVAVMDFWVMLLSFLLVSPSWSRGAVITGVSETFLPLFSLLK